MTGTARQLGRAKARTAAGIAALALAVGAIGVFAVPDVARDSLRRLAADDRLAHVTVRTSPIPDAAALQGIPHVVDLGTRAVTRVRGSRGRTVTVVGIDADRATVDRVRVDSGRRPRAVDEVLVNGRVATAVGSSIALGDGRGLRVVGTGGTAAFAEEPTVFATPELLRALGGPGLPNEVALRVDAPDRATLAGVVTQLRDRLGAQGASVLALPVVLEGGAHFMEESIAEISMMIGMLGIVAGVVALVLLASTTNAIVTERSRDAAVMRALGAGRRRVGRALRRPATTMAVVALVLGVPLGIVVSNVVARMVLERFAGITPAVGVSVPVVLASVAFALVGARLVSGRSARRVATRPLADALRDREGTPFGGRRTDRVLARLGLLGLDGRLALRTNARRRGRALAIAAQVAGAVAAGVTVASLATSVADFNRAELASWRWDTITTPEGSGYPYPTLAGARTADAPTAGTGVEVGLHTEARLGDWDFDVWGVAPESTVVEDQVVEGRWLSPDDPLGSLVMASHIAGELGIGVGDAVTLDLATGPSRFRVVGLHPIRGVTAFAARADLGTRLGAGDAANVLWGTGTSAAPSTGVPSVTVDRADLFAEDATARSAVLAIFAAIGVIVVAVAALGAWSTVAIGCEERRRELAALRVLGTRARRLHRMLVLQLAPLTAVGWVVGILAGYGAARAIMGFFESSSGVELGFDFATRSVPVAAVAVAVGTVVVAWLAVRRVGRRAPAALLRAAA